MQTVQERRLILYPCNPRMQSRVLERGEDVVHGLVGGFRATMYRRGILVVGRVEEDDGGAEVQ